ncbi:MAG: exo-alpha-sialidase [Mariniphaga sp.]
MKKISSVILWALIFSCLAVPVLVLGKGKSLSADTLTVQAVFPFQQTHCHGSTIVELPNKDLLVAWFQGSGERTADDVAIKGARYNHKTKKWGEPFIMADVPDFPDINPVLYVDNQSRLWLFWYTVMAYQWSTSILKYRISDNYMQTEGAPQWSWQDVIHMKPDGGTATEGIDQNDSFVVKLSRKYDQYYDYLKKNGQVKADGDGKITNQRWDKIKEFHLDIAKGKNLVSEGKTINEKGEKVSAKMGYPLMRRIGWQTRNKPLQIGKRMLLPLYSDGLNLSLMAITEDRGAHWTFSEPILGGGAIQPSLALNKDGSLTILMRDNGPAPKRLMKSISKDQGTTWSSVEDTDIPNPGTAADVVVLASGNWALVLNDIEDGRHRLSVILSVDEGKTWPYRKIIVNGQPGSAVRGHYPAIIQGKDGQIHICYTNQIAGPTGKPDLKNIVHASFSEEWLMH